MTPTSLMKVMKLKVLQQMSLRQFHSLGHSAFLSKDDIIILDLINV